MLWVLLEQGNFWDGEGRESTPPLRCQVCQSLSESSNDRYLSLPFCFSYRKKTASQASKNPRSILYQGAIATNGELLLPIAP
ncbi:MAG: hypothetical protein F6J93_39845 [Oscillatoria sp. SIO1A7]|nr:hypothetical protein [Oscillatoria sp. SIO1A7]